MSARLTYEQVIFKCFGMKKISQFDLLCEQALNLQKCLYDRRAITLGYKSYSAHKTAKTNFLI